MSIEIQRIKTYPVAGGGAVEVPSTEEMLGLNRRVVVFDTDREGESIKRLNQTNHPNLAVIRPETEDGHLLLKVSNKFDGNDDFGSVKLPLSGDAPTVSMRVGKRRKYQVAPNQDRETTEWISDLLGINANFGVVMERVDQNGLASADFTNSLHLVSYDSLDALNKGIRKRQPNHPLIPITRFRGNYVVSGTSLENGIPEELGWEVASMEGVVFEVQGTRRCAYTETDQERGIHEEGQPLKYLRENWNGKFGVYLSLEGVDRERLHAIGVGSRVVVEKRK